MGTSLGKLIIRENWDQAQRLFLASADLAPSERSRFLDEACAADPHLRLEVESLLEADTGSAECIAAAVESEASRLIDSQPGDARLGAYRILRPIGRGGMGAVFLATRDDDQYQKQVAIKVVKRGMDTAEVLERFRHERQILANLDHPYIARLFDGGTTADGLPYFVMEYVEGQPVDAFCKERALDTRARLGLFLRICEAVAYAHRNLVVHRDLKPANIFVTPTGTPKLLDFGIAKLITADPNQTATAFHVFTPDYASPEQVRGEAISTAADVYSLGAVLYELLTGERAQKVTAVTPLEVDRAICETEVTRPSRLARNLDTDLDNIVLMAMRKEPARRYQSADQFAADIQRYLNGEPVVARQSSFLYRAGKFLRRNRWEAAAAVIVIASLMGATIVSSLQYRRAEAERLVAVGERTRAETQSRQAVEARKSEANARLLADQQRDEAKVQRARAEQRLTDLIDVANRTLFDVNTAVETLPGALAARQTLVKTTLAYLTRLEKDVDRDDRIRLVLSLAYYKIGVIQGDTASPSLQDFAGARESFLKAQAMLRPVYEARRDDPGVMIRWIDIEDRLADLVLKGGDDAAARTAYEKLLPVAHRLAQLRPADVVAAKQEALIHGQIAGTLRRSDPARSVQHADLQISLMRALLARFPGNQPLQAEFGIALSAAAAAYEFNGNLDQAAEFFRQSTQLREDLLRGDPHNAPLQRGLLVAYGNYSRLLGVTWSPNLGRFAQARAAAARAVELARAMVAADPQDTNARYDLSQSLARLGSIEPEPGGASESLARLQEAISLMEPILKSNTKSAEIAAQLAVAREFAGYRLQSLGKMQEALEQYQASLAATDASVAAGGQRLLRQTIVDHEALALLYASMGDRTRAFDYAHRAHAATEPWAAAQATEFRRAHRARSYFVLASVQSKFGESEDARQNAAQALQLWQSIKSPGVLAMHREAIEGAANLAK